MNREQLPKQNRYDGQVNRLTKDCDTCPFHRTLDDGTRICGWGVAWKVLAEPDRPRRKCILIIDAEDRPNRSIHFIDEQVRKEKAAEVLA